VPRTIAILLLLSTSAAAHDNWPSACCGGHDCSAVPCEELIERNDGGVSWKNHVFPKETVSPSKDGRCGVCIGSMYENGTSTIVNRCAFTVQGT
jgi:hypothetical protein